MWENPTMATSRVDSKRRIVLPGGNPGDVFDVQQKDENHEVLVRLQKPKPVEDISVAGCLEAMDRAPLSPTVSWEELRDLTRET